MYGQPYPPQAPAPWPPGYPVPASAPWDPYAARERRPLADLTVDELLAEYAALRPAAEQARTQRDALDQAATEYRDRLVAIANVLPARIADEHDAAPAPAPWDLDATERARAELRARTTP